MTYTIVVTVAIVAIVIGILYGAYSFKLFAKMPKFEKLLVDITSGLLELGSGIVDFFWKKKSEKEEDSPTDLKMVGWYFSPAKINLFIRPLLSTLVAVLTLLIIIGLEKALTWIAGTSSNLNWYLDFAILLALFTWFFQSDTKKEDGGVLQVPVNALAPVTFWGTLYRIYLTEGAHKWTGRRLLFGLHLVDLGDLTNEKGFFWAGPDVKRPFKVWNRATEEKVTILDVTSKEGSDLKVTLTIDLMFSDPYLALRSGNPGLSIGERARSSLRTSVAFFNAFDTTHVKDALAYLIQGETIVVSFLTVQVGRYGPGSIVRDNGGELQYMVVKKKEGESREEATKRTIYEYDTFLASHLGKEMKAAITDEDDKFIIEVREVAAALTTVLSANGAVLKIASIAVATLPNELFGIARKVESQPGEAYVMLESAKATKAAQKELRPDDLDKNDPSYADRVAIAAASDPGNKDGKITFTRVSTSGGETTAAAAVVADALKKK